MIGADEAKQTDRGGGRAQSQLLLLVSSIVYLSLGDTQHRKSVSFTTVNFLMYTKPAVSIMTFLIIAMVKIFSQFLQEIIRLFRFYIVGKAIP